MLQSIRKLVFIASVIVLVNGCTDDKGASSSSESCTGSSDTLGSPRTIDETVTLINSLPRPLTLPCFLGSLKAPLNVFSVNSTFSAQPAVDQTTPRIFIIRENMVLSVAAGGVGRNLLEFGEFSASGESAKGELEFPIEGTVTIDQILKKTSQTTSASTCLTCHTSERKIAYKTGQLFANKVVRPNESQRVSSSYLKNQAVACNPDINKHRCEVLNSIFVSGQGQDASFPY